MNGINLDHYGDALVRNPDTWVWLVVAALGIAACLRVIALFGADDWVSFGVMLVMCWIALGCLVDVGLTGAIAGHLTDLWYWQLAASSAIWLVGSYWLVNRFVAWARAQFRGTTRHAKTPEHVGHGVAVDRRGRADGSPAAPASGRCCW